MTLMTTVKAGVVALALGAFAAPALAAPPPPPGPPPPNVSFSFNFGNGGGPGMKFNYGNKHSKMCLSDKQIYWQLQDMGFKKVKIWKSKGYQAVVVASWKGSWYQLLVDRCTGKIKRAPLKYKGFGDPGVGITLHFGF
ncbi:MAG: hypothetical protein BGO82_17640 [Devosia sp. 67-54]|uniref:hypothetical protein n=1 Tax=unclassified Devosia TaxID=196773 RepID=UPI00086DD1EF|nr:MULTISPECIES: hypothetical protein [unclassified Devosia]MBN9304200.1 hypothetical protein [Devosia sp.]ODU62411.1 MAG: hypothetical protein ABT13_01065 [Pelagibacterium sp. SCN 68-10]OJX18018.1 MAG: hypothetical protein BGO82_17640 [Devosia sp. 67-54]